MDVDSILRRSADTRSENNTDVCARPLAMPALAIHGAILSVVFLISPLFRLGSGAVATIPLPLTYSSFTLHGEDKTQYATAMSSSLFATSSFNYTNATQVARLGHGVLGIHSSYNLSDDNPVARGQQLWENHSEPLSEINDFPVARGQQLWENRSIATTTAGDIQMTGVSLMDNRPAFSSCFLCKKNRSAPLRAEGKSADSICSCTITTMWCCAPLRIDGNSITDIFQSAFFWSHGSLLVNDKVDTRHGRRLTKLSSQAFLSPPSSEAATAIDMSMAAVAKDKSRTGVVQDSAGALRTPATLLHFHQWPRLILMASMASLVGLMMQGSNNPAEASFRTPPRWSPEMEATYSFRDYAQDTLVWCITTDLQPHQQCAAIVQRLGGAARVLSRQMTPVEMMQGGMINGQAVDPVTLLFHALQQRFAPLQEETRLAALTAFMTFQRRPNERINELLTRFEAIQHRAESEAGFNMSYEGLSYTLLRIVGVNDTQLLQLLHPFNGNFPNTQQQYLALQGSMRRMGHILENQPGNIAQSLRGNVSREHTRTFVGFETPDSPQWAGQSEGWQGPEWAPSTGDSLDWARGWNSPSTSAQHTVQTYFGEEDGSSDTSTDTSSDNYSEDLANDEQVQGINRLPENQRPEATYWAYHKAKKIWRRFSKKPTRKVRRWAKRRGGKGKGGSRASSYIATDEVKAYFRGRGKAVGKSSNKGFSKFKKNGKRKNPRGPDGKTMLCSVCGADNHFRANCPQGPGGSSSSSGVRNFYAATAGPTQPPPTPGPLDGLLADIDTAEPALGEVAQVFVASEDQATSESGVDSATQSSVQQDPWTRADPWSQAPGWTRLNFANLNRPNNEGDLWEHYNARSVAAADHRVGEATASAASGSWVDAGSQATQFTARGEPTQSRDLLFGPNPNFSVPPAQPDSSAAPGMITSALAASPTALSFSRVAEFRTIFSQGP